MSYLWMFNFNSPWLPSNTRFRLSILQTNGTENWKQLKMSICPIEICCFFSKKPCKSLSVICQSWVFSWTNNHQKQFLSIYHLDNLSFFYWNYNKKVSFCKLLSIDFQSQFWFNYQQSPPPNYTWRYCEITKV